MPLLLSACASLNTRLPDVPSGALEAEQAAQEKRAFEQIGLLRERLDGVAHKVLQANVDLCKKSGFDIGVLTQTEKSFPKELREGAKRELGLTQDPVIVYVRHGSVGHRAGLANGDQLLDEDGNAYLWDKRAKHLYITPHVPTSQVLCLLGKVNGVYRHWRTQIRDAH